MKKRKMLEVCYQWSIIVIWLSSGRVWVPNSMLIARGATSLRLGNVRAVRVDRGEGHGGAHYEISKRPCASVSVRVRARLLDRRSYSEVRVLKDDKNASLFHCLSGGRGALTRARGKTGCQTGMLPTTRPDGEGTNGEGQDIVDVGEEGAGEF